MNGTELNLWSSQATLDKTTNAINKPVLGATHQEYLNGKKDTSLQIDMHLDTASLVALQAADDATVPIACVFRPGQLGVKDAGSYAGVGIITDLSVAGGAEDNWTVSLTVQGSKEWPYTAPA